LAVVNSGQQWSAVVGGDLLQEMFFLPMFLVWSLLFLTVSDLIRMYVFCTELVFTSSRE